MANDNGLIDMPDNLDEDLDTDLDESYFLDVEPEESKDGEGKEADESHFHALEDLEAKDKEKADEPPAEVTPEVKPNERTPEQVAQDNLNAERRRQESDRKFQEKMQQTPEYQAAQLLKEMYGKDTAEIVEQLKEARLQKQAKDSNVPVESLREKQAANERMETLERQLLEFQYQGWQNRMSVEQTTLKGKYPTITDQEFMDAQSYILTTLKDTNLPLEKAVYALYGDRIIESMRVSAKNDALAEIGGRKSGPVTPASGKATPVLDITPEEQRMAKNLGLTDAEYIKWK